MKMSKYYKQKATGLIVPFSHFSTLDHTGVVYVTLPGGIHASLALDRVQFEEQFEPHLAYELLDLTACWDNTYVQIIFRDKEPPGFGAPTENGMWMLTVSAADILLAFAERAVDYFPADVNKVA